MPVDDVTVAMRVIVSASVIGWLADNVVCAPLHVAVYNDNRPDVVLEVAQSADVKVKKSNAIPLETLQVKSSAVVDGVKVTVYSAPT